MGGTRLLNGMESCIDALREGLGCHPKGVASLQGWSIGGLYWLPQELAAGERPPCTLGLDVSLTFRLRRVPHTQSLTDSCIVHACCHA